MGTFIGYQPSFPEVKRTGRDVDNSPPPALRLTMNGATALRALYAFIAWAGTTIYFLLFVIQRPPFPSVRERHESKCQKGLGTFGFNLPSCEKHRSLKHTDFGTAD